MYYDTFVSYKFHHYRYIDNGTIFLTDCLVAWKYVFKFYKKIKFFICYQEVVFKSYQSVVSSLQLQKCGNHVMEFAHMVSPPVHIGNIQIL